MGWYLNPFTTNEAQVNSLLPLALRNHLPWNGAQIGFASESECNFIGFLASVKNDDLYFKYYRFALRYYLHNCK
jgi:hypothetical protein